jgi:hypothetical protein
LLFNYTATITNSFDGINEQFKGTDAAVMLRDQRAWMFKEADAGNLGWEVYASRQQVGDEVGIALVADASKLLALGKEPKDFVKTDPKRTQLYFACEGFLNAIRTKKPTKCTAEVGYVANVLAIKANEAVLSGSRISLTPDLFTL